MKSLQAKFMGMLSLMLLISLIQVGFLINGSIKDRSLATEYEVMDEIAGHMNSAAAFQAIERGVGATILVSKNPPYGLFNKFEELGKKGDAEVQEGLEHTGELLELRPDPDLQAAVSNWKSAYEGLKSVRPKIINRSISKNERISTSTKNIRAEFSVRDVTFAPKTASEQVISFNTVVRANVATLAEFAGIERAQLGSVIASGAPIPPAGAFHRYLYL